MRTAKQWNEYAKQNVTGGYLPGANPDIFYRAAMKLKNDIQSTGLTFEGKHILDVGCGNGRLAVALEGVGVASYTGVDIQKESIAFCQKAFTDNRFRFFHLPAHNPHYVANQTMPLSDVRFPSDRKYNLIVANSLFTHLGKIENARIYLDKMREVLDGLIYTTWFRSPPNELSNSCAKSVYREGNILGMFNEIVFRSEGERASSVEQWVIVGN